MQTLIQKQACNPPNLHSPNLTSHSKLLLTWVHQKTQCHQNPSVYYIFQYFSHCHSAPHYPVFHSTSWYLHRYSWTLSDTTFRDNQDYTPDNTQFFNATKTWHPRRYFEVYFNLGTFIVTQISISVIERIHRCNFKTCSQLRFFTYSFKLNSAYEQLKHTVCASNRWIVGTNFIDAYFYTVIKTSPL